MLVLVLTGKMLRYIRAMLSVLDNNRRGSVRQSGSDGCACEGIPGPLASNVKSLKVHI